LQGVDAVVHLAGLAHRRGASADELQRANVALTERVGAAAAAAGVRMVFVSSIKVHGEEAALPLRESAALAPGDDYARSKARAEEALRAIAGLQLTVLRPPLVYGPGVRANFLALMRAIARGWPLPLAGISNRRSFVYVGNLCDAITHILQSAPAAGRTFFVTDGAALSTPALCRALGVALRRPARLFAFPPGLLPIKALTRSLEADDSAIRRELGWRPPFSLEEGLQATADWYQGH
jgi:nucleoside-diphosphate-sugar epimerase